MSYVLPEPHLCSVCQRVTFNFLILAGDRGYKHHSSVEDLRSEALRSPRCDLCFMIWQDLITNIAYHEPLNTIDLSPELTNGKSVRLFLRSAVNMDGEWRWNQLNTIIASDLGFEVCPRDDQGDSLISVSREHFSELLAYSRLRLYGIPGM